MQTEKMKAHNAGHVLDGSEGIEANEAFQDHENVTSIEACDRVKEDMLMEQQRMRVAQQQYASAIEMDELKSVEQTTEWLELVGCIDQSAKGTAKVKRPHQDEARDCQQERAFLPSSSEAVGEIPLGILAAPGTSSIEKDADSARDRELLSGPTSTKNIRGDGTSSSSFSSSLPPNTTNTTTNNAAQHDIIIGPPNLTDFSGPGAYSVFGIGAAPGSWRDISAQPAGHQQVAENPDATNLARALPVSSPGELPQASPQAVRENETSYSNKTVAWALVLVFLVVLGICTAIAVSTHIGRNTSSSLRAETHKENPKLRIFQSFIEDAFGADYFDNELKAKALNWIAFEDPLLEQQATHLTVQAHLVQRYSLVAFYFQTSAKDPWKFCNPPIGTQSDVCIFETGYEGNVDTRASRWLSATHECSWMGIFCEKKNITEVLLDSKGLNGFIPSELVAHSQLKSLQLRGNNLIGTIPDWINRLDSLENIFLSDNMLTGPIPGQLFSVMNLGRLTLSENLLTGTLPADINQFVGMAFACNDNQLTGTLPEEIFVMDQLKQLQLSFNSLTGALSSHIAKMTSLRGLHLNHCKLGGTIPSQVGLLENLEDLYLQGTQLEGTIPENLYNLNSLYFLDLSGNRLSGTISRCIGELTSMNGLILAGNQISGTIPDAVFLLPGLDTLHVNGNANMTGSIPESFCSNQLQQHSKTEIVADCTPMASTGAPSVVCPHSCCSLCCDAETGICLEQ